MEHESFEQQAMADVLNAHFVSIKVDREERPDVDRVYMTFVQATTGSGGWPMSVWLTPELKPFYGGTYYPPDVAVGTAGIHRRAARTGAGVARGAQPRARRRRGADGAPARRDRIREAGDGRTRGAGPGGIILVGGIGPDRRERRAAARQREAKRPLAEADALVEGANMFRHAFDPRHGGFGDAPKFPRPSELYFLLREFARTGDEELKDLTLDTLRAMALGGMRDHIGGGFHRYSVDAAWRVPHFEKMLYDQGQLVLAYLEAAQASGEGFYAAVAEDTLAYVQREMTDAEGGFYSAEDADSIPPEAASHPGAHKMEGAFYIWTDAEIASIVGEADAPVVRARFGIEPGGNAPHDPQGEFTGKNLLYTAMSIEDVAERTGPIGGRRGGRAGTGASGAVRSAREAAASASRRQDSHRVERVDDCRLRARRARARRRGRRGGGGRLRTARARSGPRRSCAARCGRRTRARCCAAIAPGTRRSRPTARTTPSSIWGVLELFEATGAAEWLEWAITLQSASGRAVLG